MLLPMRQRRSMKSFEKTNCEELFDEDSVAMEDLQAKLTSLLILSLRRHGEKHVSDINGYRVYGGSILLKEQSVRTKGSSAYCSCPFNGIKKPYNTTYSDHQSRS